MSFLVDANVLSEPTKPRPNDRVVNWLEHHDSQLVVNSIVLGELEFGILLLPAGRRRKRLLEWFHAGISQFNVVALDAITANEWAALLAELRRAGRSMPIKDSLIAASARQHDLAVVTRNVADYRHAGVRLLDPFA